MNAVTAHLAVAGFLSAISCVALVTGQKELAGACIGFLGGYLMQRNGSAPKEQGS